MTSKSFTTSLLFVAAVILTLGLSISFQSLLAAYTAPLANPATCLTGNPGCDAPINTSTSAQITNGSLWMVNSGNPVYGLIVEQGKVGFGTNITNLDQLVAQLQVTAPASTEGLRIISASDYSPLNIRNNANSTDIFRVDQSGTLAVGAVPWARLASFPTACDSGKYISALSGTPTCSTPSESGDAIVGNEVTDAANATLTRSGSGTAVAPYKLALNIGNANTWTAVQTFPGVTINGDLTMNGDINMAGGDIAEGFKVLGKVEPGDVLVISNQADDQLIKSSQSYQKTVAGVVSTDPAVKLGDKNQPQVALSGTAPVKVSGENGIINPGDMLTTSTLPGYAMKCSDQKKCFGAIIGKALEKFSGQTGVIKMLISLQ